MGNQGFNLSLKTTNRNLRPRPVILPSAPTTRPYKPQELCPRLSSWAVSEDQQRKMFSWEEGLELEDKGLAKRSSIV